ncbi:hypothetical protein MRX96_058531 [Rhipicephalus microplus]
MSRRRHGEGVYCLRLHTPRPPRTGWRSMRAVVHAEAARFLASVRDKNGEHNKAPCQTAHYRNDHLGGARYPSIDNARGGGRGWALTTLTTGTEQVPPRVHS